MPSDFMALSSCHCGESSSKAEKLVGPGESDAIHDDGVLGQEQFGTQASSGEGLSKPSFPSPASVDSVVKPLKSLQVLSASEEANGIHLDRESSLFSSSLSDLFSSKLRLLKSNGLTSQTADTILNHDKDGPFETSVELEAQTIGNLLPDEDDLFSGVIGHNSCATSADDYEDFDLFSSGGGMELEGVGLSTVGKRIFNASGGVSNGSSGFLICQHPSRMLVVQNISSHVEDSELKAVFEQYGDIRTLYTAEKHHHGFAIVSYYDIRAAQIAFRSLQSHLLRSKMLDMHYCIPKENLSDQATQDTLLISNLNSSISNEELYKIFSVYGQIKEISDLTHERTKRFIEYYDVRSAEAALNALPKIEFSGQQVKIELCVRGVPRSFRQLHNLDELHGFDTLTPSRMSMISSGVVASGSKNAVQVSRNPVGSLINSSLGAHRSASIPIDFRSPARVAPIGKPIDSQEANHCLDEMQLVNQFTQQSHSLPECLDSFWDGSPYKTSKIIGEIIDSGCKMNEGFNTQCFGGVQSNGHQMGFSKVAYGASRNGSLLHGNKHIWGNNNPQPRLSSPMMWPNSPSSVSGIRATRVSTVAAYPRALPMTVNAAPPINFHIGSAPGRNPAFRDRRNAYVAGSPESSAFHIGSHGSVGFPGSSPSHPMEIPHQNVSGNVVGPSTSATYVGFQSPQQMCHHFPGRSPMLATSYDTPLERLRSMTHHRNESIPNNVDKKQYELDIDRIIKGEDNRTTLMIKNIPNKYTSKMLLAAIDEHCKGTYDFIYLPIDFKNKCNVGYAFINMIDPQKIIPFHEAFNGKKWEKFNSEKVASLAYARIQGKSALIAHFQNSSLMNEDKRCRPILFCTDGPNAGDQEPFPMGANIRSRPGKPRIGGSEEAPNVVDF